MSELSEAQKVVAKAVEQRGYRKGWSDLQFLARQVCKLQEELGELAEHIDLGGSFKLNTRIHQTGLEARDLFKHGKFLGVATCQLDIELMKAEAADMLVVLFALADCIERMTGEQFNLVLYAMQKATADVARGVRK